MSRQDGGKEDEQVVNRLKKDSVIEKGKHRISVRRNREEERREAERQKRMAERCIWSPFYLLTFSFLLAIGPVYHAQTL